MKKTYNIVGIGSALIDISLRVTDEFLEKSNLTKGSIISISKAKADEITNLKYDKAFPGGVVANTISTLAKLNIKTNFIGKVGSGPIGSSFLSCLKMDNIHFQFKQKGAYGSNGRSFIMATPDGQRTMATFLGCSPDIDSDINEEAIINSDILYIEGFLWKEGKSIDAIKKAIDIAKNNNVKIAFIVPDAKSINKHRDDFIKLIDLVNIIFINEDKARLLFNIPDLNQNKIRDFTKNNNDLIISITRGKKGVLLFDGRNNSNFHEVPAHKIIENPTDLTGAGEAFACGFLYGAMNDCDIKECGRIGNLFAKNIIQKLVLGFSWKISNNLNLA